jgi:zinc protease
LDFRAREPLAAGWRDLLHMPAALAASPENESLPPWPHERSDLAPDPALVFGRFDNGFRYVLLANQTPKDRVSMHLVIQAGSLHESEAQRGLAHYLEHMLFNGSTHFKPGELVKFFQSIGMQFGPDANAHTGFDRTVYDVILPDGRAESIAKGLLVMQDYAQGALLLESEVERERKIILAEKRTRDSAAYRTFEKTIQFELPGTRAAQRLPIGVQSTIEQADAARLRSYYDQWYRPDKMILVMVGDFEPKMAASSVKKYFENITARAPRKADPALGDFNHQGLKAFYHHEKEAGKTNVSIGVLTLTKPQADSAALQKSRIIERMTDQIVQHRLNALVSRPDAPFTSARIGSGTYLKEVRYAEISATSNPEDWQPALEQIEKVLRQAIAFGFTQAEIERVQKDFLSELDTAVAKADTRNTRSLSRHMIHYINQDRVFQSPRQERDLLAPAIKAAGSEQLHDAFRKRWADEHRLIMVTGNAKLPQEELTYTDQILAAYQSSNQLAVSKPIEEKAVVFPYLPDPDQEGIVASKKQVDDLGLTQIQFANGVRLNMKPTDFKDNEVLVNVSFGAGRHMEPPDKPGLALLSQAVFNESGLGQLRKEDLERALAGKQTSAALDISENKLLLEGVTVTTEIPLLFQLLRAHIVDPGFRPEAYQLVMERFAQQYQSLAQSIDGSMRLYGRRFLAGGDSRFGFPEYEKLQQLTLEDVRRWLAPILAEGLFEVSVVGDFHPQTVETLAARYLGGIQFRKPLNEGANNLRLQFPETQNLDIAVDTQIDKGLVVIACLTDDFWDIRRTRRLSALSDIFSERMREIIREKLGATYSPYAYNRSSRVYPGYGVFSAIVHVDPQKAELVIAEVKKIMSDMALQGVTEDEVARSIDPLVTSIKDMRQTNEYWLNSVLTDVGSYPQQLDWSRSILEDYAAIKADELSALAKKYFKTEKAAIFIAKPSVLKAEVLSP